MNGIFSKRFKALREEKDKTQQELLDEFNKRYHYNFKKSSISMYENAKRMPEIEALTDFADYFQVSVDYLLGRSDIRNPYKEKEERETEKINTIAGHIVGDGSEYTKEELEEIEKFKQWVLDRKKNK